MEDDDDDADYSEREILPRPKDEFPYNGWDKPSGFRKEGKTYPPEYKGDNSGGYKNPPVSGQRKKGGCPGPGRPKGSTSLSSALKRAFRRKLPIVRDGRLAKLHPTDILAERIVEAILAKNLTPAMIELARRLMEEFGPQTDDQEPAHQQNFEDFSNDEFFILSALAMRSVGEPPGETRRHVLGTVHEPFPTGEFLVFRREDGHAGLKRIVRENSLEGIATDVG